MADSQVSQIRRGMRDGWRLRWKKALKVVLLGAHTEEDDRGTVPGGIMLAGCAGCNAPLRIDEVEVENRRGAQRVERTLTQSTMSQRQIPFKFLTVFG